MNDGVLQSVDLMKILVYDMSICHSNLNAGVAEEFLDLSHVGASVQQMGGERMAEYMGTFLTLYAASVEFRSDDAVDGGPGYSFAFVS